MTYCFVLSLYLFGWLTQAAQPTQTPDAIKVSGICFDVTTAVYLPVEAYAMSGTTRIRIGQSDKEGKFFLLLPLSATSISFTSPTYRTVTLPVRFVNPPGPSAEFRVGIIMGKQDSAVVRQTDQLVISNDLPDAIDVDYSVLPTDRRATSAIVVTAHGNRVPPGLHTVVQKGRGLPFITFEGASPGLYQAVVSTTDGRILTNKAFTVTKGLTFLEVRADAPDNPSTPSANRDELLIKTVAPITTTVYFEQSRYELTATTKASLDSLAQLMMSQPRFVARITGHTDNVGEQSLNLTLSEYRAKLVGNYLQQKGVLPTKLLVDWKGGNAPVGPGDTEEGKAKNRRVVVQVSAN